MNNYLKISKNGLFYNSYETDAYILNYLCDYKIINKNRIGFPESKLSFVKRILDANNISYKIFEKDELIYETDYEENNYSKYAKDAIDRMDLSTRVDNIVKRLNLLTKDELALALEKIEKCI